MSDSPPLRAQGIPPGSEAIARRLRELERTIASLADLVLVVNRDGLIVECNGASERVWGLTPREVLGRPMPTSSDRLVLIDRDGSIIPAEREPTMRALVTGSPQRRAVLGIQRADEAPTWAVVTAVPALDGAGEVCVISIWTDVTAAIELEADRARAAVVLERRVEERTAELEATIARLDATVAELETTNVEVEAFSYSVSHDLRSPVRAISALAETLLDDFGAEASAVARDLIARIRDSALRMDALIETLLRLSSATHAELKHTRVDLSALARGEIVRLRERDAGRQVDCVVTDGIVVFGDEQLLGAVLANLLGNAWKFTVGAAKPRIEVGVRDADTPGERVYYVRDNGMGFDVQRAGNLFAPFRRLESAHGFEGSGVGLAIVGRIVTRHGGRVWAESAPGAGATFCFTLPAAP